jgi:hypothetical protein
MTTFSDSLTDNGESVRTSPGDGGSSNQMPPPSAIRGSASPLGARSSNTSSPPAMHGPASQLGGGGSDARTKSPSGERDVVRGSRCPKVDLSPACSRPGSDTEAGGSSALTAALPPIQVHAHHTEADGSFETRFNLLVAAVNEGDSEEVSKLLAETGDLKVDLGLCDSSGRTALMHAAEGESECVRLLLAAGHQLDAENTDQRTALDTSISYDDEGIVKLLLEAGAKTTQTSLALATEASQEVRDTLCTFADRSKLDPAVREVLEQMAKASEAGNDGKKVALAPTVLGFAAAGIQPTRDLSRGRLGSLDSHITEGDESSFQSKSDGDSSDGANAPTAPRGSRPPPAQGNAPNASRWDKLRRFSVAAYFQQKKAKENDTAETATSNGSPAMSRSKGPSPVGMKAIADTSVGTQRSRRLSMSPGRLSMRKGSTMRRGSTACVNPETTQRDASRSQAVVDPAQAEAIADAVTRAVNGALEAKLGILKAEIVREMRLRDTTGAIGRLESGLSMVASRLENVMRRQIEGDRWM